MLTDHISSILFCPTETAVKNLNKENITKNVYNTGDVMYDSVLYNVKKAEEKIDFSNSQKALKYCNDIPLEYQFDYTKIESGNYILTTIHRAENTDGIGKLEVIVDALNNIDYPVVFPVHPRIRKNMVEVLNKIKMKKSNISFIEPVGYLEMLVLDKNARKVVTDSGGLQKEAYFLKTPCITLREQTEWLETLNDGWNVLCGIDKRQIISQINSIFDKNKPRGNYFGDGNSSAKIAGIIAKFGL
ncbi:MAG TPA: hypothetical protein DD426_12865 [Clostridiaceae bacterium]|nr:hypothetical protein [Clostridiaceae bacterium]